MSDEKWYVVTIRDTEPLSQNLFVKVSSTLIPEGFEWSLDNWTGLLATWGTIDTGWRVIAVHEDKGEIR